MARQANGRRVLGFAGRWALFLNLALWQAGCAAIFGWDIHAPGLLSGNFAPNVQPMPRRLALYLPAELLNFTSEDRGGRFADPQTYHVGEALGPMLVEGFQTAFDEFVFLEAEPAPAVLKTYGIPYVSVIRIKEFKNRVGWRGQAVSIATEIVLLDLELRPVARFEAHGTSDAQKVFAKRGGPQVNLNAALEQNVLATVQYLQDFFRRKSL